jgi:hypothetical protein
VFNDDETQVLSYGFDAVLWSIADPDENAFDPILDVEAIMAPPWTSTRT